MNYSSKYNNYNFSSYLLPTVFLRKINKRRLSVNEDDEEQSVFYNEIKRVKHGKITDENKKVKTQNLFLMEVEKLLMLLVKFISNYSHR